jgi:tetratricopeptide (TPR) repeat protein
MVFADSEKREYLYEYEITVHYAKKLADTDAGRKDLSDPYVALFVRTRNPDSNDHSFRFYQVAKTRTISDNCNPKWEQTLKLELDTRKFDLDWFYFRIIDEDKQKDKDIGTVRFWPSINSAKTTSKINFKPELSGLYGDFKRPSVVSGSLTFTAKQKPKPYYMPNYYNKKYPWIKKDDRLKYKIEYREVFDKNKDMYIYRQRPSGGSDVFSGTEVTLYVNRYKKIIMPYVVGLPRALAQSKIERLGLKIKEFKEVETSNIRDQNNIAAQNPKEGATEFDNKYVTLKIFKYKKPDPVDFPNVIGESYIDAIRILRIAGFHVAGYTKKPYDAGAGEVIACSPDPEKNDKLLPGRRISLVLAAPDKLGVTLAYPFEKKEGEEIVLNYGKNENYYIKITAEDYGYIRLTDMQGSEDLPLSGKFVSYDKGLIDDYSNWKNRRSFRVEPGDYYYNLGWDAMVNKNESNTVLKVKYEFIPEMDKFEPNDSIYDAKFVLTGQENEVAVFPGDDIDWFCYEPEEDGYLRITLGETPKAIRHDFLFHIYESGKKEDLHAGEYLPVSAKVFAGKKYFIKVSILGVDRSPETFRVKFDLIPEKDETEPNDTFKDAYEIKGSFTGRIYIMGKAEREYFKLIPEEGARTLTLDIEHNEYMIRPRVYWASSEAGLEDADYCKPRDKTCTIPVNGEDPIYLYVYNDHEHNYSDDPMTLTISYQHPQDQQAAEEGENETDAEPQDAPEQKTVEDADARADSIDLAKKAYQELKNKNYDESISLYKQALELYKDKRYWHDMGLAYFRLKDWKNARECFQKAIDMDMSYYLGYKSLGSVLGEMKKYEFSIQSFERALAISDKDPMIYYNLARSYEGLYREDNSKVNELKKAFEYSSIAKEKIKDDQKVNNQFKRLKSMIKKLDK